jgi:hypothetical protein
MMVKPPLSGSVIRLRAQLEPAGQGSAASPVPPESDGPRQGNRAFSLRAPPPRSPSPQALRSAQRAAQSASSATAAGSREFASGAGARREGRRAPSEPDGSAASDPRRAKRATRPGQFPRPGLRGEEGSKIRSQSASGIPQPLSATTHSTPSGSRRWAAASARSPARSRSGAGRIHSVTRGSGAPATASAAFSTRFSRIWVTALGSAITGGCAPSLWTSKRTAA